MKNRVILILSVLIMGLGLGVGSYYYLESRAKDKALEKEKLPSKEPEEEEKKDEQNKVILLKQEEKKRIDETLNLVLYPAIMHKKSFMMDFCKKELSLLDSQTEKFYFAMEVLRTTTSNVEFDYQYLDDISGEARVLKTNYQSIYKNIFGKNETIPLINEVVREEENYIYFDYVTGWGVPSFALKVQSLEKNGTDEIMKINLYTDILNETVNEERVLEFLEEDTVDDIYLKGTITITYQKKLVKSLLFQSN